MGGRDSADRVQALLLLLPAGLLVLPIAPGPLVGAFEAVEATGAGALLLAALPAGTLGAWRAWFQPTRLPWPLLAFWLAALAAARLAPASDRFGRDAALATLAAGTLLALGAAGLGATGRRWLVRGLVGIALGALLPALAGTAGPGLGGVVGNTGEVSGAALCGSLAGALLGARGRGPWRWLGWAAALAFALHALLAPVLAALGVLGAAAGIAAWVERRRAPGASAARGLLVLALLCVPAIGWVALGGASAPSPTARPLEGLGEGQARPSAGGDLGGVGVRTRIWRASLGLVRDHPLLGVGPGQFAATFPPYRDPKEIERSTHGRALGAETEVEHPHSDPVLALGEVGLVGGLLWLALTVLAGARALALLRSARPEDAAAALGALAILLGSLVNAHLLANPPAGAAAFPLLGLVLAGDARPRSRLARAVPALALAASLSWVAPARDLLAHGRALAGLSTLDRPSLADLELALAEALEARPDSVVARDLWARLAPLVGVGDEAAIARTRAVLEVRPHRVAAWIDLGARLARGQEGRRRGAAADPEGARRAFEHALDLDPWHPVALENLARLELFSGRVERGLECLGRLAARGRLDPARTLRLGAELLLHGQGSEGQAVLALADARFADLSGERAQALAREFERRGELRLAEALEAQSHRIWAHEHAARGDFDGARRSLFQCLRITRDVHEGGAPRVRLEYAAALLLSGRGDEAPAWVAGLGHSPADLAALPAWASGALVEAGLWPPPR